MEFSGWLEDHNFVLYQEALEEEGQFYDCIKNKSPEEALPIVTSFS
jgi:hypothetical protein